MFTNFLSSFAGGLFGDTGYLKDYKHASRLYVDNKYGMTPKAGWSYFIEIGLNPQLSDKTKFKFVDQSWYNRSKGKLGLVAKSADLPRFTITHETLNQYNKKTNVQTKIVYNPISITFHDDMDNMITDLWKNYYQYYYADSLYTGFSSQAGATSIIPAAYQQGSQYNNRAYAYGFNNSQSVPFFSYIKIFLLNRSTYSSVTLVNPIITEWNHGQLDQSNGTKLLESKMSVAYEAVYYDTKQNRVSKTQPGFNQIHYDNSPSPLSVLGGKTKGLGGLLSGSADVLGILGQDSLSVGDIINVAIGTKNIIQGAKSLTKAGIKQELTGIVSSAITSAAAPQISEGLRTPINTFLPKATGTSTGDVAKPSGRV